MINKSYELWHNLRLINNQKYYKLKIKCNTGISKINVNSRFI